MNLLREHGAFVIMETITVSSTRAWTIVSADSLFLQALGLHPERLEYRRQVLSALPQIELSQSDLRSLQQLLANGFLTIRLPNDWAREGGANNAQCVHGDSPAVL